MKAYLHGVRRVDMTGEKGDKISGFSCFLSYPSEGVQGEETNKVWVSDDLASACAWSPSVGKIVQLDFTPKGRVCGIATVNEK